MAEPFNQSIQQQMLALMVDKFPTAFFPVNEKPKPLKIGIKYELINAFREDLKSATFRKNFWAFLRWYMARKPYKNALITDNAMRIDLNGTEVMAVSDKHKAHAKAQLDQMLEASKQPEHQQQKMGEQTTSSKNIKERTGNSKLITIQEPAVNINLLKPKLTLKKTESIVK